MIMHRRAKNQRNVLPSVAYSIGLAASSTAVSVAQSNFVTITFTLTRNSGYSGTVNMAVSGLPSGVNGSWSTANLTGATLTTILTLTADVAATIIADDAFVVTASGSGVSDVSVNATVSVTSSTGFAVNRPSGLTTIGDTTFASGEVGIYPSLGTQGLYFEPVYPVMTTGALTTNYISGGEIVADPTGTAGSTNVYKQTYEAGSIGGGVGGAHLFDANHYDTDAQGWTEFYICTKIYVTSNYSIHSNGEKCIYLLTAPQASPASTNGCLTQFWIDGGELLGGSPTGNGETPTGAAFSLQCIPNLNLYTNNYTNTLYQGYGWIHTQTTSPRMAKGQWKTVEVYHKMNTPGNTFDGVLKIWIDGTVFIDRSDIQYGNTASQQFIRGLSLEGIRGGGDDSANPVPTGGQSRYHGRTLWAGVAL